MHLEYEPGDDDGRFAGKVTLYPPDTGEVITEVQSSVSLPYSGLYLAKQCQRSVQRTSPFVYQ
jgi:hypothetical protein